jgi:hypothetical protein
MAANNTKVWKLREAGYPLAWMMSPAGFRRPMRGEASMPFALDNGMFYPFGESPKGMKGLPPFYAMLRRVADMGLAPEFVTIPDAPYNAAETRRLFPKHQRHVRAILPGVRVAMAVQDGMDATDLDMIDGPGAVFVGGSTEWKWRTAAAWTDAAHRRGMWSHIARVNTRNRIRLCVDMHADSADGTGIFRGDKQQLRGVLEALTEGHLFKDVA